MKVVECDGCGHQIRHADSNLPDGWASIRLEVNWSKDKDSCEQWETDNSILVCSRCRGSYKNADALLANAEKGAIRAIDRRPQPADK